MGIEQRVCAMSLLEHRIGQRPVEPAVVGLSGELEDPALTVTGIPSVASSFTSGQIPFLADSPAAGRP